MNTLSFRFLIIFGLLASQAGLAGLQTSTIRNEFPGLLPAAMKPTSATPPQNVFKAKLISFKELKRIPSRTEDLATKDPSVRSIRVLEQGRIQYSFEVSICYAFSGSLPPGKRELIFWVSESAEPELKGLPLDKFYIFSLPENYSSGTLQNFIALASQSLPANKQPEASGARLMEDEVLLMLKTDGLRKAALEIAVGLKKEFGFSKSFKASLKGIDTTPFDTKEKEALENLLAVK